MSRLNDLICEEAGRRIYEAQQSRLGDQACVAARRRWRSPDVPQEFWDGYCADARAALSFARYIGTSATAISGEIDSAVITATTNQDGPDL
jgi:hypothetical protein